MALVTLQTAQAPVHAGQQAGRHLKVTACREGGQCSCFSPCSWCNASLCASGPWVFLSSHRGEEHPRGHLLNSFLFLPQPFLVLRLQLFPMGSTTATVQRSSRTTQSCCTRVTLGSSLWEMKLFVVQRRTGSMASGAGLLPNAGVSIAG